MLYGLVICPGKAHSNLWTARDLFRALIDLVSSWRCYSLWLYRRPVSLKYISLTQQNANSFSSDDWTSLRWRLESTGIGVFLPLYVKNFFLRNHTDLELINFKLIPVPIITGLSLVSLPCLLSHSTADRASQFLMEGIVDGLMEIFGPRPSRRSNFFSGMWFWVPQFILSVFMVGSGKAPNIQRAKEIPLPHITIQMPVYKESLT